MNAESEADDGGIMRERLVAVVDGAIKAWWGSLDPRPTLPEAIVAALLDDQGNQIYEGSRPAGDIEGTDGPLTTESIRREIIRNLGGDQ